MTAESSLETVRFDNQEWGYEVRPNGGVLVRGSGSDEEGNPLTETLNALGVEAAAEHFKHPKRTIVGWAEEGRIRSARVAGEVLIVPEPYGHGGMILRLHRKATFQFAEEEVPTFAQEALAAGSGLRF